MENECLEGLIDKEIVKQAGKMLIPIYNGVVTYRFLHDSDAPKYMRALVSCFYAVSTFGLELSLVQGIMYRITN